MGPDSAFGIITVCFMLEIMTLSRGRAAATKDKGKAGWELTTIKGKRRRRNVKCTNIIGFIEIE